MTGPDGDAGPRVFIAGAGRVGSALAVLLARAGVPLAGIWSRTAASARAAAGAAGDVALALGGEAPASLGGAEVLLLAVRDDAVAAVARGFAHKGLLAGVSAVLHCGGARASAEVLPLDGVARGTFHPLVSVPSGERGTRAIAGACIALEGDERAVALGQRLARAVGGRPLGLDAAQMPLYHAAAVVASNHAVALWHAAARLLQRAGFEREQAVAALLPLLRSTLDNVDALGLPEALTGPVRRGDVETIERHLTALAPHPAQRALYLAGTCACLEAAGDCAAPPAIEDAEAIARLCRCFSARENPDNRD